jgi:hypothetical protein
MSEFQARYQPTQNHYTEPVLLFLKRLSPQERQRQERNALENLVVSFQRMGPVVGEDLGKGKRIIATADAVFEHGSERLTAVIMGTLTPGTEEVQLTVRFMLPEEFDRDVLPTLRPPERHRSDYEQARDDALLSMDESCIRAFCGRYEVALPPESEGIDRFWTAIHMVREQTPSLPMEERQKSKQWLDARGIQRPPGPYSLDETPSTEYAYAQKRVLYVQPVHRQEPNGLYTVWVELIREGRVLQRVPLNLQCRTVEEATQAGMEAAADMSRDIQKQYPHMEVF